MLYGSHKFIITVCICSYCPCFAGGGYCSDKCGCQPCFNKEAYAETVQTTRKVLLSRQKRMSMKINRRPEANAEPMVVILTRLNDVALFKFLFGLIIISMFCHLQEDAHHSSSSTPPRRGCNCKKSSCLKKYCDCYQVSSFFSSALLNRLDKITKTHCYGQDGTGCSLFCRCDDCQNPFGKNGTYRIIS